MVACVPANLDNGRSLSVWSSPICVLVAVGKILCVVVALAHSLTCGVGCDGSVLSEVSAKTSLELVAEILHD